MLRNRGSSQTEDRGRATAEVADRREGPDSGVRESREELEATIRNKDAFLALLGHELRRPLSVLTNATGLLESDGDDEAARKRVYATVRRQVDQMARLVDDLLDVTRVAHGKIALERQPVDLASLVRDVLEDHLAVLSDAGVEARLRLEADDATVDGDPTRLAQVLGNLMSNAAKFTPPGGHVEVALTREGGDVRVTVTDDGIGMDEALVDQLFEPYRQVGEGSKGGLGLGLPLVRALTELHGGRVEAFSAGAGRGSCFTVKLPLAGITVRGPVEPCGCCGPHTSPRSVLVVDDDEDAGELLGLMLERRGYRVARATNALDALEVARVLRPDIVVSDLDFGRGIDGHELARRLRRDHERGPLLVALSGHARDSDRARSRAAGFAAHLAKPVKVEPLIRLLDEHAPVRVAEG